ncbi:hypothetical protein [Mycolicibacterium llatzerense]|uniref:hypothetical protein n=1 Tax=Mycolicibacterium llatzerense TaxID=280871 RepID=UPI0008DC8706|nr:hypothetical protein [Mycolicibacterium llatzerense]
MQDFLHDVMAGLEYFTSPVLITSSARAALATAAVFSGSERRRKAALRALRALNGWRDRWR